MAKTYSDEKKEVVLNDVIGKKGVYRPLKVKGCDFDYALNEYFQLLIKAKNKTSNVSSKAGFWSEIYQELYSPYNAEEDEKDERIINLEKQVMELQERLDELMEKYGLKDKNDKSNNLEESNAKAISRYHKRLIEGLEHVNSGIATDSMCYDFLMEIQKVKKKTLLTPKKGTYYYENMYIYSLLVQLIEVMFSSEFYNYIPNTGNYQYNCYKNHIKMIEENISEIFVDNDEKLLDKWNEILSPLQELIYNCNYPGFREGDIWLRKCNELRFFDCTYMIAKDYELYKKVKGKLAFDLGDTEVAVKVEMKKYRDFLEKNSQDEKILFCNRMISTLKIIMKDEFGMEL